jgi:mono/diheme cytochrome c family protein
MTTQAQHDTQGGTKQNRAARPTIWLRRLGLILGALVTLAALAAAVLELRPPRMRAVDAAKRFEPTPERLARGRYIVEGEAHCLHCHSDRDWQTHGAPVLPGLQGAGWDVPWADNHMPGPVFAPNLTPDRETGLGAIPDDAIARAIREGVSHDGRALFMMPWQNYRNLSDDDVAAVVAYLRALPPVNKPRGTTAIKPPVRWFLKAAAAPLTAPVPQVVAAAGDRVARGRHLSEVGQCQSCHTPVDARHQPLAGQAFAGGQEFTIGGVRYLSANITPDPSGISYYSEELFIRAMRTGNVGGRRLAPIMPWSEIAKLTDDDLKALWAFLQTVAPVAHEVARTPVELKDNPAIDDRLATSTP